MSDDDDDHDHDHDAGIIDLVNAPKKMDRNKEQHQESGCSGSLNSPGHPQQP